MLYKEISSFEIHNKPEQVMVTVTDNANHFSNDLYILSVGNNMEFDAVALRALEGLKRRIERVLEKHK